MLKAVLKGFLLGVAVGFMIVGIVAAFSGCAHDPFVEHQGTNQTRRWFCEAESCPAFARIHGYQLLRTSYVDSDQACECELLSPNMPDSFVVSIPIDAPADAPADSL